MGELLRAAWIGMWLSCPACRQGRIYETLTTMNHECPHCHVVFEREEGDFTGAVVVAYSITSVLVAMGIFIVELLADLSVTQHAVLWTILASAFLLLTYRNMKGIWIGILHVIMGLQRQ